MVSAREVAQVAVYGGPLEKKGRTGWKKKYFYVTATQWIYFDSIDAASPNFSISATEISNVEEITPSTDSKASLSTSSGSNKGFVFHVTVGKKRSELRAATEDERDGWIGALMAYVIESSPLSSTHTHHPKSRSRAELSNVADYIKQQLAMQKKKSSFTSEDVIQVLSKKFPDLSSNEIVEWGETLLHESLILGSSFKPGVNLRFPEKTKKKLNISERSRLSDLMSAADFDAKAYAESFLKRNAPEKIREHCDTLLDQKDAIIHELKNDICANYKTFLVASSEIRTMENSVSSMKAALVECKRALLMLQTSNPETSSESMHFPVASTPLHTILHSPYRSGSSSTIQEDPNDNESKEMEHSLEIYLFEQDFEKFTEQILRMKAQYSKQSGSRMAQVVEEAVHRFVTRVMDEGDSSFLNRDSIILHLIQLDQVSSATLLCIRGYTARMTEQVRLLVKPTGNPLGYVLTLSRTVFTTLLMCFEDFLVLFEGQPSLCFASFTMWMTDQMTHFANQIRFHIFEENTSSITRDVAEFKPSSKTISSSMRQLFYGARQLELAGLPIATYLAPHFQAPLQGHICSYAKTIKWKIKEEVKRERWELVPMKVRDEEMREKEVVLSKSARVFSGYVQQYLRDIVKLMQPSYPTSHLPEIQLTLLVESELVLIQYMQDIKAAIDNIKTITSVKYSQVASMLITMQYIQDDILPRVVDALRSTIPKNLIENSNFGAKIHEINSEVMNGCMHRLAKALVYNSMRWLELDLSSDILPKENDPTTLFLTNLRNEMRAVSPDQLEQLTNRTEEANDVAIRLMEFMWNEIINDHTTFKLKTLGYGGTSQFIAELRMLSREKTSQILENSLRQGYSMLGKKGGELAPDNWYSQYAAALSKS